MLSYLFVGNPRRLTARKGLPDRGHPDGKGPGRGEGQDDRQGKGTPSALPGKCQRSAAVEHRL